jgi:peptide/nickel transport system substrate-binding protein
MGWRNIVVAATLGAVALSGSLMLSLRPAFAGKADDTLRYAVNDWWSTLDPYQFPLDEAAVFFRNVYETLISYDERNHKFVPRLAKAWRQVDDKTFEFDLRDDVKFHNGDHFDADDVRHRSECAATVQEPLQLGRQG